MSKMVKFVWNMRWTQANNLWTQQDVEFIFRNFQILEKKFMEILNVFPLSEQNENSWSPELVNLFLDISSMFDSISRNIVGKGKDSNDSIPIHTERRTISKKVKDLDINDFERSLFRAIDLLDSRVVIYVYPASVLTPLEDYKLPNGWWSIYNSLKHNRVKNYKKATLKNTLKALASLFLLLARYKEEEFTLAMFRFHWFDTGTVPEYVHSDRLKFKNLWYDSELFGTHEVAANIFSNNITKIRPPSIGSKKFQIFVRRYNQ